MGIKEKRNTSPRPGAPGLLVGISVLFLLEEGLWGAAGMSNIRLGPLSLAAGLGIVLAAGCLGAFTLTSLARRRCFAGARRALSDGRLAGSARKVAYYDAVAPYSDSVSRRHALYHAEIERILNFLVPADGSLIEIGCGTGDLPGRLDRPGSAGVDLSPAMVERARAKYPGTAFEVMDAEALDPDRLPGPFDYVIMSDLIGQLHDVQHALEESRRLMREDSRLVVTTHSFLWEPALRLLERLHIKIPQFRSSWLGLDDIRNLMELAGMEVIKQGTGCLCPASVPLLAGFLNRFLVRLPLVRRLGMIQYMVARLRDVTPRDFSLSVVIPARNEAGNIEQAVRRAPELGAWTELIFVEGGSTDGTWEEIQRVRDVYGDRRRIKILRQPGKGKGDAVRAGFAAAEGDIVTILDGDLTVRPEELEKFYRGLALRRADFVNGCRLVYPMEKRAMRFFNVLGNRFFSLAFTWLLGQRVRDTLCGTKMLLRSHYERIAANRAYFGEFDPFGDYDLLFGAAKLNLKILDLPIRYQARTYGDTNISRWSHGALLLRMTVFALRKLKFF